MPRSELTPCDVPAIVVSGGPMLNGKFCGQNVGSGTDVWRFAEAGLKPVAYE